MVQDRDQAIDKPARERARPGTLRNVLFDRIVELLLGDAPPGETEARALLDTLARLLPTLPLDERKALALRLTRDPAPPAALAGLLARDDIAVARMILESALPLDPEDLKEIAAHGSDAHRLALAGRADLTAPVTEVLIEHGNAAVVERLVTNPQAAFSLTALARLAADFRHIEAVEAFLNQSLGAHDRAGLEPAQAADTAGDEAGDTGSGETPAPARPQGEASATAPETAAEAPEKAGTRPEVIALDQIAPSERALRESLMRSAAEVSRTSDFARAAADWSWETDADGRIIYLSDHAITAFGLPPAAMRGARLTEFGRFLPGGSRYRDAGEAMARHIPFREAPFEARRESGERTRWLLNGVPLFDLPSGAFRGYRGTAIADDRAGALDDVDDEERQALEQQISELEERHASLSGELEAAHQASLQYADRLAGLTHELRTPLNAIIGFSEIIAHTTPGTDEEKYHAPAQAIRDAAWQLNALVGDALISARVDAGVLKIDNKPLLVDRVVDAAIAEVLARANRRGVTINLTRMGSGLEITSDEDWVKDVIGRLLGHAVEEAPRSSAIALTVAPDEAGVIRISVEYDAPCPPGGVEALFRKLEPMAGDNGGGLRVGRAFSLALARDIARYMGGEVEAACDERKTRILYRLASAAPAAAGQTGLASAGATS